MEVAVRDGQVGGGGEIDRVALVGEQFAAQHLHPITQIRTAAFDVNAVLAVHDLERFEADVVHQADEEGDLRGVAAVELGAGGVGAADEANLRGHRAGVEELERGVQLPVTGVNPDAVAADKLVGAEQAVERGLGGGGREAGVAIVADGRAIDVVRGIGVVDIEVGWAVGNDGHGADGTDHAVAVAREAYDVILAGCQTGGVPVERRLIERHGVQTRRSGPAHAAVAGVFQPQRFAASPRAAGDPGQRLHAAQGVVGRQVQDGNARRARRERGIECAAKRTQVAATAVGGNFVANQAGGRGGINARAGGGVGREGGTGRGREGRARVTARRAGEMEIVVPAVGAADDAVRACRVHELRVGNEAVVVLLGGILPVSQLGLVAVPLADDGAAGGVNEVVVAFQNGSGIPLPRMRIADERDGVGASRPDDVVAVRKHPRVADVNTAAAIAGVVLDESVLRLVKTGAADDVEIARPAAVQVAEVVDDLAGVAGEAFKLDAVTAVGIDDVSLNPPAVLEIDARAAVAKRAVAHHLVVAAVDGDALGSVAVAQVVRHRHPAPPMDTHIVVLPTSVARHQDTAAHGQAVAGVTEAEIAHDHAGGIHVEAIIVGIEGKDIAHHRDLDSGPKARATLAVVMQRARADDQIGGIGDAEAVGAVGHRFAIVNFHAPQIVRRRAVTRQAKATAGELEVLEVDIFRALQIEDVVAGVLPIESRAVGTADDDDGIARRADIVRGHHDGRAQQVVAGVDLDRVAADHIVGVENRLHGILGRGGAEAVVGGAAGRGAEHVVKRVGVVHIIGARAGSGHFERGGSHIHRGAIGLADAHEVVRPRRQPGGVPIVAAERVSHRSHEVGPVRAAVGGEIQPHQIAPHPGAAREPGDRARAKPFRAGQRFDEQAEASDWRARSIRRVAERAEVEAPAVGRRLLGKASGGIAAVDAEAQIGVRHERSAGRRGESRAAITAGGAAEVEVGHAIHEAGFHRDAVQVAQGNLLPGTHCGARPEPVARDGAVGDVDVVVIAADAASRIRGINGRHARAARGDDVVDDRAAGVRRVNAVAADEGVVPAHAVARQNDVPAGATAIADHQIVRRDDPNPTADAVALVVADSVLRDMRGVFRDDAIAAVGRDEVANQSIAAVAHHARAAVGVTGVADGLGVAAGVAAVHPQPRLSVVVELIE